MQRLNQWFRNLGLRRKLSLVTGVICTLVLLLACAALFAFQEFHFRQEMRRDLMATAEIISANSVGPLKFKDQQGAAEVLASLKAKPHIISARIESGDGAEFARVGSADAANAPFTGAVRDGLHLDGFRMLLAQPIADGKQRLGTLYLSANTESMHAALMRLYGGLTIGVLAVSLSLGLLLSARLQGLISQPILTLAGAARLVAEEKNYSVRAEKSGNDEVGSLTDAFNQMLSQIETDAASLRAVNRDLQNEIVVRERVEAARRAADEQFRSLTNSAHDAILTIDSQGHVLSWNQGAREIFGYAEGEILRGPAVKLLPERHHAAFAAALEQLRQPGEPGLSSRGIELQGVSQTGEEVPIELSLCAWRTGADLFFGAIIRNITERKRAAQELDALNRRLLETSRQAGMAEVATSVLHNVGNVLNSVNVSATVLEDRIRGSRITTVNKLSVLVQSNAARLPEFFATDPRGQKIPALLNQLSIQLTDEQKLQLEEVEALRKYIDHIKEIVVMQQTYARVSGVTEMVSPAALLEDALRIDAGRLDFEKVEVDREFEAVPAMPVDRHKVMQILVNLLRNARHAICDARPDGRRLRVRIYRAAEDRIAIQIIDNGIGIAPENLTRVFQHGFTTKKEGHGFGLHSGANAAKEMGGSLSAHSDGPGHGATFTLELPWKKSAAISKAA